MATADIPTSSLPHAPVNGSCDEGEYLDKGIINVVISVHLENLPRSDVVAVITQNVNAAYLIHIPQSPIILNGCHQCRKCPTGSFDKVKCTGTHNSKCSCLPGWYCATDSSQTEDCRDCIPKGDVRADILVE